MNDTPENFDGLRRLLTLKRHEQPPPGYFDRLPAQIRRRLDAPARADEPSLLERLFSGSFFRPAVAQVFLAGFCILATGGVVLTLTSHSDAPVIAPIGSEGFQLMSASAGSTLGPVESAPTLSLSPVSFSESSTNPVIDASSGNDLFDGLRLKNRDRVVPASAVNR